MGLCYCSSIGVMIVWWALIRAINIYPISQLSSLEQHTSENAHTYSHPTTIHKDQNEKEPFWII